VLLQATSTGGFDKASRGRLTEGSHKPIMALPRSVQFFGGKVMVGKRLIASFIVIVLVWTALGLQYGPLELRSDEFALFGRIIGSLILVSAIMERGLDVFLTFVHGEGADLTSGALAAAQKELNAATTALEAAPGDSAAESRFATAKGEFDTAQNARREQRGDTRRSALPSAIVLGVLISAISFRALDSLVVAPTPEDGWWAQGNVFHAVDIFLTGAVLAGGSDGLHKLMEVYRSVTESKNT